MGDAGVLGLVDAEAAVAEVVGRAGSGAADDELGRRRPVGRPRDLEGHRGPVREAHEGGRGVVDVEVLGVRVRAVHVEVGVIVARAELAPGLAGDLDHLREAEEVEGEVDGVHADVDEGATARDLLRREPRPPAGHPAPADVVSLDVRHVAEPALRRPLARRAFLLYRPGRGNVIGCHAVAQQGQTPRPGNIGYGFRLGRDAFEKRRVLDVCGVFVPVVKPAFGALYDFPFLRALEHVGIARPEHLRRQALRDGVFDLLRRRPDIFQVYIFSGFYRINDQTSDLVFTCH